VRVLTKSESTDGARGQGDIDKLVTLWEDPSLSIDDKLIATFRGFDHCLADCSAPIERRNHAKCKDAKER